MDELLEKLNYNKIIMHCFSGNMKLVDKIIKNNWNLSIPANVKHSEHFQKIVEKTPIKQLFCETDSPFLHPDKLQENEPANVIESYKKISEIKALPLAEVEKQIEENALPIIPMLREAEVVINPMLIKEIRNSELTYKNIGFHINTTKSALKTIKEAIGLCRQSNCSDALAYSLALRFREAYIVECLIKDKMWSNKEFISLLKNISGSPKAYYGYLRVKNKEKELKELKIEEANKLYQYLEKKIKEQEKWALKRK